MLIDGRNLDDGEALRADVCIVGAGAAGITLARDLRDSGLDVLLLESGGLDWEEDSAKLNEGEMTGLPYGGLRACRVRMFGGSTNHWNGWCRTLDPDDFEERPFGAPGWPLSYEDLLPYYVRGHETCELGALDYDAAGMSERLGMPMLPLDPARVETAVYQFSPPTRFGQLYRQNLEDADDVRVYYHATASNIVLSTEADAVERLDCKVLGDPVTSFSVTADRYVLATGGLENARLMLASDGQVPEGVGNGSGALGRGFMEHPHWFQGALLQMRGVDMRFYDHRRVSTMGPDGEEGPDVNIRAALALSRQTRDAEGLFTFGGTLRPARVEDLEEDEWLKRFPAEHIEPLLSRQDGEIGHYWLDARAEQRPKASSRVSLTDDTDALGMRRIDFHWEIDEQDREDFVRACAIIGAELGRAGLGRLWIPLDDEGRLGRSDQWGCHHIGTTRMTASPSDGVVDADGRVHDVPNLYVAGSSIFPTAGYANPTLTIVALAHRLADHLKETA